MVVEHWSDCAVYNEPAHPAGPCDCGGLDLADYGPELFRPTLIAGPGRFGFFVKNRGTEGFVEAHQLPPLTLAAVASAANLPDAHAEIASLRVSNGVNLDDAREAVIAKFENFLARDSLASGPAVHLTPPTVYGEIRAERQA